MPFDRPHLRLTWGGRLGTSPGSPEIWQTGLKIAPFPFTGSDSFDPAEWSPDVPDAAALAVLFTSVLSPLHSHAYAAICQGAVLQWARIALVGQDGRENTTTQPAVLLEPGTDVGGAIAGNTAASPQDAVCVTLWSGATTGKGNYGRFYVPWSGMVARQSDGSLIDVDAFMTNYAKPMVDGVNAWARSTYDRGPTDPWNVAVAIMTTKGPARQVRNIRVGHIKDTIRRRRNRLTEAPIVQPVDDVLPYG